MIKLKKKLGKKVKYKRKHKNQKEMEIGKGVKRIRYM